MSELAREFGRATRAIAQPRERTSAADLRGATAQQTTGSVSMGESVGIWDVSTWDDCTWGEPIAAGHFDSARWDFSAWH